MVRDGQEWQRVGGANFLVTLRTSFGTQNCVRFVSSHRPVSLLPFLCSLNCDYFKELRMQIIAQKAGYKKAVRLSANWIELKAVCFQTKHYNSLFKKVSSLASPSGVAAGLGGEVWALWPPPPALVGR